MPFTNDPKPQIRLNEASDAYGIDEAVTGANPVTISAILFDQGGRNKHIWAEQYVRGLGTVS
ncbi:hypothetical protein [Yoonia sp.]|uniref:hypothetical protein n=1 Tax=Yoonia sp. TaxID=2212373 RepID=UPI0023913E4A|nr:hypothetical protein [Yoonia sp.]MDE0852154.1 hypothetical protein [Yoonia sp.]